MCLWVEFFLTHCRIGSFRVLRQSFCGKFEFSADSGHPGNPLLECMSHRQYTPYSPPAIIHMTTEEAVFVLLGWNQEAPQGAPCFLRIFCPNWYLSDFDDLYNKLKCEGSSTEEILYTLSKKESAVKTLTNRGQCVILMTSDMYQHRKKFPSYFYREAFKTIDTSRNGHNPACHWLPEGWSYHLYSFHSMWWRVIS